MWSIWNNLIYNLWQIYTISKDKDSKRSSSRCFQGNKFASSSNGFVHAFSDMFFSSKHFFFEFFNQKRIICTAKLCNKNCRLPCSFKRKRAFISLLSLPWGKSLTLCRCTRSLARANDAKIVRSRDAQCNTKESP